MDDTQRIVKCGNLSLHTPGGFFKVSEPPLGGQIRANCQPIWQSPPPSPSHPTNGPQITDRQQ